MSDDELVEIHIDLTDDEYERIEQAAAADGVSMSDWVRRECNARIADDPTADPRARWVCAKINAALPPRRATMN